MSCLGFRVSGIGLTLNYHNLLFCSRLGVINPKGEFKGPYKKVLVGLGR